MQNKKTLLSVFLFSVLLYMPVHAYAADADMVTDADIAAEMEAVSADAIAAYDATGSLFQQITDLEQEKVLMELEKERAQLNLELDKLAAEKIKLHMEIDELSGRAEQQQQELQNAQAKLEAEAAKLEREKEQLQAQAAELTTKSVSYSSNVEKETVAPSVDFSNQYRLLNVVGIGQQLQAKIENLDTGQTKTISVGKDVDGYVVQSISLDDGIVFSNGQDTQTLSIGKSN